MRVRRSKFKKQRRMHAARRAKMHKPAIVHRRPTRILEETRKFKTLSASRCRE